MQPIYTTHFEITDNTVDRYGRLKPSQILYFAQEMGGQHCVQLALDYETLAKKRLFWAVVRHRVQVTRLPARGETIRVETWPLPATRTAYPRSVIAYDEAGNECFRAITLWVLMDMDSRNMILPGKSGISVEGTLRGNELTVPGGLICKNLENEADRTVAYSDLDRNGHMNNTRCMDWLEDLFPSEFHAEHPIREFTVCYLAEAREGQLLSQSYGYVDDSCIQLDTKTGEDNHRVFSVRALYE